MVQQLYFEPLRKAIRSLKTAIQQPKDEFIRDSVIQRFEYTYELSWKLLKRFLEVDLGSEAVDRMNRKDLYRIAAEKGIISDVQAWFKYHQSRNLTSHTYNEEIAEQVYMAAKDFLNAAQNLLQELEQRALS